MKNLALILLALTALSGCAALDQLNTGNAETRFAIRAGTIAAIKLKDDHADRAQVIVDLSQDAEQALQSANNLNTSVTVVQVKGWLIAEIRKIDLDPAETVALEELVNAINLEFIEQIEVGQLDSDTTVKIQQVIDLVRSTAVLYL